MSWEEMSVTRIPCPCGKGTISQAHYSDDWNRFENGQVVIECEECRKKYKVEGEHHQSYHPGHGDWTIYYLTPIEYPPYTGICENNIYGPLHTNIYNTAFEDYLIEQYSLSDLEIAKAEYSEKFSSSKVTGIAKQICKDHKRFFNSVRAVLIIEKLEIAVEQYRTYEGSYDQRIIVRQQENQERKEYQQEKRKHQIKLDL